jgi:hypothetical protein
MRVRSDKVISLRDGSIGYVHPIEGGAVVEYRKPEREKPKVDIEAAWNGMIKDTEDEWRHKLARQLGVTYSSIMALGAAWYRRKQAWAFPMRDGGGKIVGIRLRSEEGKKWALVGSANALFIPKDDYFTQTVYLVEGPTDVMAGVSIGLKIIGRPSCSAGMPDILRFIKENNIKRIVQIADNDTVKVSPTGVRSYPGTEAAEVTAQHLPIPSLTLTLPVKDLRAFVKFNGTASMLKALEKSMVWRNPH